jgi:hypothetical protein
VGLTPIKLGEFELIHDAENPIIGGLRIGHREKPVEGVFQFVFVDLRRDVRNLFLADVTAQADNAGQKSFVGGTTTRMFGLPVRKFLEKVRGVIDRRQDFQQRNEA